MEREYIHRIKSVSELELIRQVVFHTFAGKVIDVIIKAYPDSGIVSKYPLFAFDVVHSYVSGEDNGKLRINADVAMSALIDILNRTPEDINPLADNLEEIYETWQHTLCVILHASMLATETDIPHAVGLIASLGYYSPKDLALAFKRFKRLENAEQNLNFVDIPTILEALTTR